MNRTLYTAGHVLLVVAIFLIAGCASSTRARGTIEPEISRWQGRLSLKVHSEPVQAFSANFDLQGDAQVGSLVFMTPIGSIAARLQSDASGARLQTSGEPQQFETLEALTHHATGAPLPIGSMFAWLHGLEPNTPGWQVDLQNLPNGRLSAQRLPPETPVELKIILDR